MKSQVYYFGISKDAKNFVLFDPIAVDKENNATALFEVDDHKYAKYGLLRGLLILDKSDKSFVEQGKLIKPDAQEGKISYFFLEDRKLLLIKINEIIISWKNVGKKVWNVIKDYKLVSKKLFFNEFKDFDYADRIKFTNKDESAKFSIVNEYATFVSIESKNYNELKTRLKALKKK
jgi:hypothetical protein